MVSLTIDGKTATVAEGSTILEAASSVGIQIPTLCWLEKVSPTGACRICAVEIEGIDRPITACNTPVKDGINVTTQSENLAAIRRKVTELLLVNHPLDCPVCDAAGECDLQDTCYNLDVVKQEYAAVLERRKIRYDWPLLESDPNRCILCEKCVKVDHEVVGADAIAVTNCGEATVIETETGKPLKCEFCGNCVAVCPTGTLIAKPFKFKGRPWTYNTVQSVCPFCPAGCQIEYNVKENRIDRVTSDDKTYNSGNLCINGRFGYSYVGSPDRLAAPLLKAHDRQLPTDWEKALSAAVRKLQDIVRANGAGAVAGICSPRVTNEESYLFHKLLGTIVGTGNIASEASLGYGIAADVLQKTLGISGASATIDKIDNAAAVFVIGTDLNAEATNIEYRVIKAATKNDAKLVLANMRSVKLKKFANNHLQYRPGTELSLIAGLIKVIIEEGLQDASASNVDALKQAVAASSVADLAVAAGLTEAELREAARLIAGKKSIAILFGGDITRSTGAAEKVAAIANLALLTGCVGKESGGLFPIDEKNNIQGLLDMQTAAGKSATVDQVVEGIEKGNIKALYVLASDPVVSFPNSTRIKNALAKLELLIVQDIFPSETSKMADVVFAGAAPAEKEGTFTTIDNRVQCLYKAVKAPGDARADLDIIADVAGRLCDGPRQVSSAAVLEEIRSVAPAYAPQCGSADGRCTGFVKASGPAKPAAPPFAVPAATTGNGALTLVTGAILYHSGTSTTWSENNLSVAPQGFIEISADDASRLGLGDGAAVKVTSSLGSITAPARISDRIPAGLVFAPNHFRTLNVNALLDKGNMTGVSIEKA